MGAFGKEGGSIGGGRWGGFGEEAQEGVLHSGGAFGFREARRWPEVSLQ